MTELPSPTIAALKRQIEHELADLVALEAASAQDRNPVKLDQQSVGRLARMDAMQVQAMAVASGRRRSMRIQRLREALDLIESGEFGYCEHCGEQIPEGRLKIDPTAQSCVNCARLHER